MPRRNQQQTMRLRRASRLYTVMRGRLGSEGGFTLIEVMAASGILLIALMALAYTATVGFSDVALARQRQGANSLANQTMEQVRALPFDTVRRGLANNDLNGDSNITQCGSPAVPCYGGERLVLADNPPVVPLVPHRRTITVGPTTYTVSTYVTYYENNATSDTYRVTVVATWPNPARQGVDSTVVTQSLFYSGAGCTSTATHPFAGPCQPFLYGNALVEAGHADITGTVDGLGLEYANLWLPSISSNMQIEQISAIQGSAQVSGLTLKVTGLAEQTVGRQIITSKADTDPAQPGNIYQKADIPPPPQVGGTLSRTVLGNSLTLSAGAGGDQAETTSAASALTSTYPCADRNNVARNDGQPCGTSNARLGPNLTAELQLVNGILDLGVSTLVSIEPPSGGGVHRVAFTNRDLQHEAGAPATECPSTSGDGCVHANAYRSTGDIRVGGLLSAFNVLAPLGWQGYLVRILPATGLVSAEVGTGTSAPTATWAGNISYWNGTGYSSIPIIPSSGEPITVNVGPLNIGGGLLLPGVSIRLSATVTQGSATKTDPAGCSSPCTRTTAVATSASPIIDLSYRVTAATVTVADLNVHLDLGSLMAQSSYQPAPTGA
jgi:prepilin-type N-terminal cleavage/methylation domain-containing protein